VENCEIFHIPILQTTFWGKTFAHIFALFFHNRARPGPWPTMWC